MIDPTLPVEDEVTTEVPAPPRVAAPPPAEVPVYALTVRQLRQLRTLVAVLVGLIVVLVIAIGVMLPRSMAYNDLFEENLTLRTRIAEIDRKMSEVDRVLLRMRLYDAQIKSLGGVSGDHGGALPDDGEGIEQEGSDLEPTVLPDMHEGPVPAEGSGYGPADLRPAEVWASAVEARIEAFLSLASLAEPNLNEVVRELEDLRALDQALPNLWPADGRMTSGFGWRRSPFGRTWRFHSGLDIAGGRGGPIYAAAPGRVLKAGYNAGYGRMVEIDHGFGITTLYGHCTSLLVREGDKVDAGVQVGTIGSTGRSTGPHLHFEVRLDGHPVDPLDYLPR